MAMHGGSGQVGRNVFDHDDPGLPLVLMSVTMIAQVCDGDGFDGDVNGDT